MGATSDDGDTCAVCLERVCSVAAEGKFLFHTLASESYFTRVIFWLAYRDDYHADYFCVLSNPACFDCYSQNEQNLACC